ncbi:MAG: hypothetical protein QOJ97_182 [Solirubrobacteraceae bacterium]|jgi:hypothetical protein|nr:hypothetical protein [Solirubrobacteraceae bacterium]
MYGEAAHAVARRLHGDPRLREEVAQAMGRTLDEFDEQAPAALQAAQHLGQFGGDTSAVSVLQTGTH